MSRSSLIFKGKFSAYSIEMQYCISMFYNIEEYNMKNNYMDDLLDHVLLLEFQM